MISLRKRTQAADFCALCASNPMISYSSIIKSTDYPVRARLLAFEAIDKALDQGFTLSEADAAGEAMLRSGWSPED